MQRTCSGSADLQRSPSRRLPRQRIRAGSMLWFVAAAAYLLLAAGLTACGGESRDFAGGEPDTQATPLEQSPQLLADENDDLQGDIAVPGGKTDETNAGTQGVDKDAAPVAKPVSPGKEQWDQAKPGKSSLPADSGGEVHLVDHPGRETRTVLVTPVDFIDGGTPLIVSLHGYGSDSADLLSYVPLHQRVNARGFAFLLPNGTLDAEGNRFWNPTDHCCDGGKSGENDVAYLTELVAGANKVKRFGPVYFFGYSNGGFMAHHMACKGLPDLRAVAGLAGTSYVENSSCADAPPVSVLHVHGTADSVIFTWAPGTWSCAGAAWPGANGPKLRSLMLPLI